MRDGFTVAEASVNLVHDAFSDGGQIDLDGNAEGF